MSWLSRPPESLRIQRLRGELVGARAKLTVDLQALDIAAQLVAVDDILLAGCVTRLARALGTPEED